MWFLYVRKERCLRRAVYQNGVSEELCIKRSRSVSHNGLCPEEYDSITWAVSRGVRLHFLGSVSRKSCTVCGDSPIHLLQLLLDRVSLEFTYRSFSVAMSHQSFILQLQSPTNELLYDSSIDATIIC